MVYMDVTGVGQNGDLHSLLRSLNALVTEPYLAIVRDEDGIWNQPRKIHVTIEEFSYIDRYDAKEPIREWETDMASGDSLCAILDTEANFEQYVRISGWSAAGVMSLDLFLTGRTYAETKSLIDTWGRSLFQNPDMTEGMRIHIIMARRQLEPLG